jgi:hypothetical protein
MAGSFPTPSRQRPVPPALPREARAWLFAPPTGAPLSLDLACALAGVDPDRERAVARLRLP